MALLNVSPTRMELTKVKNRFMVAVKGHKLLKDKRDELMRQFLEMMRETKDLRRRIEERMTEVNHGLALASSVMQKESLISALMIPKQNVTLEIASKNIMGVDVPVFTARYKTQNKGDVLSYGYAFTSGDLDRSILTLSDVLPGLLLLAQQEKTLQTLAAEIEKTRRRVNALEYTVIPNYLDTIRYITMKLDENERGNLTRLMKIKDMMVTKQIETNSRLQNI